MSEKENKKDSIQIALQQIQLITTLSSAFIVAPIFAEKNTLLDIGLPLLFLEGFLILSIFFGYGAMGAITSSIRHGTRDIEKPLPRWLSILQSVCYVFAMLTVAIILYSLSNPKFG